jgi:hypothetical protein
MKRILVIILVIIILSVSTVIYGADNSVETSHLIVRDLTKKISADQLGRLASSAEETLQKIIDFWQANPKIGKYGKIRVDFERLRGKRSSANFVWRQENGRKIRVVRMFGLAGEPQMLAHKLTPAIFPSPDKLIRNMMGILMEVKFGNKMTFPMCGFNNDSWVLSLHQTKHYIHLNELGPSHEDWGSKIVSGLTVPVNKVKLHASYAESGSFAFYLLDTFGTKKMKAFYKKSRGGKRPWLKVFGLELKELEENWNQALKSKQNDEEKNIKELTMFLKKNPKKACLYAQDSERKAREKR